MSVLVSGLCWKHADVSQSTLLVLLAMADIANDHGQEIWPRLRTLAEKCRMSERQVQRSIGDLKKCGMVELVEGANGKPGQFNSYVINLEAVIGSNPSGFIGPKKGTKTGDKLAPVPVGKVIHTGDICDQTGDICDTTGDICDLHIDNRPRSVLDPSFARALGLSTKEAAAREVWAILQEHVYWKLLKERVGSGEAVTFEGGALVVEFPLPSALSKALVIRDDLALFLNMKVTFRLAKGSGYAQQ